MSYGVKDVVLKAIKTLLSTVTVEGTPITYFSNYFGKKSEGINFESYQQFDDSNKHFFGNNITLTLNTFSPTLERTSLITRAVLLKLKASVTSKLQLSDGWDANYTLIPQVTSLQENDNGIIVHRDIIRFQIRVSQSNNNS